MINMKTSFYIFLLVLIVNSDIHGQKIQIKGGLNYLNLNKNFYEYTTTRIVLDPSPFIENRYWRREERKTFKYLKAFRYRFGGQISARINLLGNSKNNIGVGVKASYFKFGSLANIIGIEETYGPIIEDIDITDVNFDLENNNTNSGMGNLGFQNCDLFTNEIDFNSFRLTDEFSFSYFSLPISYEYDLVQNQVSLFGEITASKLIHSHGSTEYVPIHWYEEGNQIICTYVPTILEGNYKEIWNDINFGIDIGTKLWFGKFGIEASYGKFFGDIFNQKDQTHIPFGQLSVQPDKFELNLIYLINHEKRSNSNFKEDSFYKPKKKKRKKKKNPYSGVQNLWYSPTAFSLKAGFGKYKITDIVNHSFEYGLTKNFSITGGLLGFPPIFNSEGFLVPSIRGKGVLSFNEKLHIGFSASASYYILDDDFMMIAPTIITTFGDKEKFVNLSYGYLLPLENDYSGSRTISIGGALKINELWSLITDNVMLVDPENPEDDTYYMPSIGMRKNNQRNQLDLGIYYIFTRDGDTSVPFPLIAYTRFF